MKLSVYCRMCTKLLSEVHNLNAKDKKDFVPPVQSLRSLNHHNQEHPKRLNESGALAYEWSKDEI